MHAEQKAMEVTKTTDDNDYEPDDPDEEEEGSQRKQKRAREGHYMQKEVPPSESGYNSEGEHTIAAANESTKDARSEPSSVNREPACLMNLGHSAVHCRVLCI